MMNVNALLDLGKPLVLASTSPRRSQLLHRIGMEFSVIAPDVDEDAVSVEMSPGEYVERLALLKAQAGADIRADVDCIVLGSDTTVILNGVVLNKPSDSADAKRMLQSLQDNTHTVYTGIALVDSLSGKHHVAFESTLVTFRPLTSSEIDAYVATGSPLDKAGAYGIQDDFGAVFVSRIEGCYYTIVGLPLQKLYCALRDFSSQLRAEA